FRIANCGFRIVKSVSFQPRSLRQSEFFQIRNPNSAIRIREMLDYAESITKLIDEFKRLPSIGQKSAQRLAFHILRASEADVERLIEALPEVKQRIMESSLSTNLTDVNPCRFCSFPSR